MLLDDGDQEVARATVLRMRTDEVDTQGLGAHLRRRAATVPMRPARQTFPFGEGAIGFWNVHDVRLVVRELDPNRDPASHGSGCGVRSSRASRISPIGRVAAAADFGSGVSNPVRLTNASAINPELTVHVHRHPMGEWVCLESGAWAQPHGVGMAETRLHDEHGVIGRGVQALLVEPAGNLPMHVRRLDDRAS